MSRLRRQFIVLTLLFFVSTVAYQLVGCAEQTSPPSSALQTSDAASDVGGALRLLSSITVEPEHIGGYRREDWPHWRQGRSKCITIREEVLIAESQQPVVMSADGCAIISGHWVDAYTGHVITDPKQLDVDHMVPLEEASQSGGWTWSRDQRAAYANDVTDPRTLIAVSATANRSKGSKGPEGWLPENLAYRCVYIARWTEIKARWKLTVDEREAAFLKTYLLSCQQSAMP